MFFSFLNISTPFFATHDNDLLKWCDICKNQTGVSPVLRNLPRLNTPGLIGLRTNNSNLVTKKVQNPQKGVSSTQSLKVIQT